MESAKYQIGRMHARERAAATAAREQRRLEREHQQEHDKTSLSLSTALRTDWHIEPVSPSISISSADSASIKSVDYYQNHTPTDIKLPSAPTHDLQRQDQQQQQKLAQKAEEEEERGRSRTRELIAA